jgi:hypothetical protein
MAEQRFNYFERRAIWEAHGRRCAYCSEPLSFGQLEIDHILPESLIRDAERWSRIRKEQDLPIEFNLRGYENLEPSCRVCNARKLAQPFPPGRTAIELGVARRAKSRIEDLIARFRTEDRKDKLRFAIAGALETGQLSEREIANVISATGVNADVLRLSTTLQLFGDEPVGEISRATYERYLDVRLPLPSEMQKGLRLVTDNNEVAQVLTLREYQEAAENGFHALSNLEIQLAYRYFERPLAVLHILRTAKPAERSFMDEPRVGLSDISLVPATLLFVTEDMTSDPNFAGQRTDLRGKSIQNLVSSAQARITEVASDVLGIEYDGNRTFVFEILRADVNGDGIQDMLIHWGASVVGATFRAASTIILTRRSEEEMFSTLE